LTTLRDVDRGAGLANHPDRCQPEEHCVGHDVREEGDRGQRGDRQQPVAAELWHARLCEGRARAGGLPDRQHGHAPDVVVQVHAVPRALSRPDEQHHARVCDLAARRSLIFNDKELVNGKTLQTTTSLVTRCGVLG
jgi:hypothetical protein